MRRMTVVWALLLGVLGPATLNAQPVPKPPSRTQITVDRNSGLITVTFDIDGYVTLLFLPEDMVPGERFSGRLEPEPHEGWNPTFIEAGGQRGKIHEGFTWTVPSPDATGNVEFVLRGITGGSRDETELARVAIRVMASAPHVDPPLGGADGDFIIPATGQIDAPFPIAGPFDGDGTHTSLTVHGTPAMLLAETRRHALFHLPPEHVGVSRYVFVHNQQTREGRLRAVRLESRYARNVRLGKSGMYSLTVTGLEDLREDLVLAFHSRRVSLSAGAYGDPNWLYITPADAQSGAFKWRHGFDGEGYSTLPNQIDATLIVPVTREQQLTLILWDPRRRDWHKSPYDEKAEDLRPYLPESRDALVDFWKTHGMGNNSYEVLIRLDPDGAARAILDAVPSMGSNGSGIAAIHFYTDRVLANPSLGYQASIHDAALRLLRAHDPAQPYATCCPDADGAIYALGKLGDRADIPFLEELHDRYGPWYRQATEAVLMRFGIEQYIARTRDELAAPLPRPFTIQAGMVISDALKRAGFSRHRELVPLVCRHLHTPGFGEGDVTTLSPASDAMFALWDILGHDPTAADCAMRE